MKVSTDGDVTCRVPLSSLPEKTNPPAGSSTVMRSDMQAGGVKNDHQHD